MENMQHRLPQIPTLVALMNSPTLGNGRNTVSRVLTVSEERTHSVSLSFGANSVSSAKNSVSSLCHTNSRLRGTH